MSTKEKTVYQKINEYGFDIRPEYNEETSKITSWAVFGVVAGGYWGHGATLKEAIANWEKLNGKV